MTWQHRQNEKLPLKVKARTDPLCSQAASSFQSNACEPAQTFRCPRRPGRPGGEHSCAACQVCCSKNIQCFLQGASCVSFLPGGALGWADSWSIPGYWCKQLRQRETANWSSYSYGLKGKYTTNTTQRCINCLNLELWCHMKSRVQANQRPACFWV